ncbi:MAG TPA: glycerophosphodiester phosphodiesterase family protein [Polyangiales bacterium]|nr:glycerophosphodiester phosphodiesterase family protein [Polyangiales bacterium]
MDGFAAQGPLLFAHRGAPSEHAENTLPAFAAALEQGADVLELDVRMSSDGHVMVSHDETGQRVYGMSQAISCTNFSTIKRWRVKRDNGLSYEPATLAEVLEAFPKVPLNVDVKQESPSMLLSLFDVIMGHAAEDRVLLTSFSARTLHRIRRLGYRGPIGMSQRDVALFVLGPRCLCSYARRGAARLQIPTRYAGLDLSTRLCIEKAHAFGLPVDYWVVNDPAEAERLLDLGADGIVTDEPKLLADVFARHVRARGFRKRRSKARAARALQAAGPAPSMSARTLGSSI